MTIHEVLDLPTANLAAMNDVQLETYLGPLIPAARKPDAERAQQRQVKDLLKFGEQLLAQQQG